MNGAIMLHLNSPCDLANLDSIVPAKAQNASTAQQILVEMQPLANDLTKACSNNRCGNECVQICKPVFKCFSCQQCMKDFQTSLQAGMVCGKYMEHCAHIMSCHVKSTSGLPGKVAVFDGRGKDFAPCELDSMLLKTHASKAQNLPFCQMPHVYMDQEWVPSLKSCMSISSPCNPPQHISKKIEQDSCSLCNSKHCKCASSGTGNAMDSIMENMLHDRNGKRNIGKEVRVFSDRKNNT